MAEESDSTFRILVTTDNHLGFAERDPRRGDDSFTTFEEILRAGRVEHEIDFGLFGGDLFHENKPSLGCMVRTCSLMRKYILGDKPIKFSMLSDPAVNFPTHAVPLANFQDPNINVSLPIFAIHGNHDDPVGGTSSLDVLATNGLINYFGHVSSLEEIELEPILLRKGSTFVALYGLGNVRDERLHRCLKLKKVHFVYPKAVPGRKWFKILVVHQNRGVRGVATSKNGIHENMLAGYGMDLVIWGNEHEQLMVPQPSNGFDVIQPGSSVLTSLSSTECNPKQYGVLEIRSTAYRLTGFPLRSVRPAVRRVIELRRDLPDGRTLEAVESFLRSVVEEMITEAEEQLAKIPDDVLAFHPNIKYPLMRLAVDFTDLTSAPFPQPNINRFGQQYMDVIANPGELLRPVKPKVERNLVGTVVNGQGKNGNAISGGVVVPMLPQLNTLDIRTKVADVFNSNTKDACLLLSEPELSAAVYAFAEKGERSAIDDRLAELLHATQKSVWRKLANGADDGILQSDIVTEEVLTHKRHVNERYCRLAAADEQPPQQDEDGSDEEGGSKKQSFRQKGEAAEDAFAFATIEVPPSFGDGPAGGGGGDPFLTSEIQRFLEASDDGPHGPPASSTAHTSHRGGRGKDEEEDGEELPGDGLDRVSVAEVMGKVAQEQGPPRPPAKRGHQVDDGDADENDVVDVDDDGVGVRAPTSSTRGKRSGAAPAAKKPRTRSGAKSVIVGGDASGGMPTLDLMLNNKGAGHNTLRAGPLAPASTNKDRAKASEGNAAMLDLVSKWSGK